MADFLKYLSVNWPYFIVPIVYLIGLKFIPKGIWKTFLKFEADPKGKEYLEKGREEQIKKEIKTCVDSLIVDKKVDTHQLIQDKVFKAINYSIGRHDWYENQRSRIFNIILWISGFALTFVGLLLRNSDTNIVSSPALLAILMTIVIGLVVSLFVYNKDLDTDRPYRLVSDIRFWFFRYNLPSHSGLLKSKDYISGIADEVLKERSKFFERISDNFIAENSIREDFEQLFILHVLQRYKSESLIRLRWLMSYTMLALIIELIIFFL